eukprot:2929526-Rhodomonas_salina.1
MHMIHVIHVIHVIVIDVIDVIDVLDVLDVLDRASSPARGQSELWTDVRVTSPELAKGWWGAGGGAERAGACGGGAAGEGGQDSSYQACSPRRRPGELQGVDRGRCNGGRVRSR